MNQAIWVAIIGAIATILAAAVPAAIEAYSRARKKIKWRNIFLPALITIGIFVIVGFLVIKSSSSETTPPVTTSLADAKIEFIVTINDHKITFPTCSGEILPLNPGDLIMLETSVSTEDGAAYLNELAFQYQFAESREPDNRNPISYVARQSDIITVQITDETTQEGRICNLIIEMNDNSETMEAQ